MNRRNSLTVGVAAALALILVIGAAESGASSSPSATAGASSGSSSSGHKSTTATQARQSPISAVATMIGALGSSVPGLVSNIAPLVLLLGVGALMMPSLGFSAMGLLRESRRSASDPQLANMGGLAPNPFAQFGARPLQSSPQDFYYFTKRSLPGLMPSLSSGQLVAGLQELLERAVRAIENADKRYN